MTRSIRLITITTALVAAVVRPAITGPALASHWLQTTMTQESCLRRAEESLHRSGFRTIEPTRDSRYGAGADQTGAVRCIASNRIIIFMATGPDRARTDALAGALFQNFDPERP
jgi:hypothetical protein